MLVTPQRERARATAVDIVTQDVPDVPDVLVLRTSSGQKNIFFRTVPDEDVLGVYTLR